jgi:membrane-associated phospholipid phosphatase
MTATSPQYTASPRTGKVLLGTSLLIVLVACIDAWRMHEDHIFLSVKPVLDAVFVLGGALAVFLYGYVNIEREDAFSLSLQRQRRHSPNTWFMAHLANQFAWGGLAIITLNYIGFALNRPLIDGQLLAADQWLGFDWYAYMDWTKAHPWAAKFLYVGYHSMLAEMALLIALLGFTGQYQVAHRYVLLFLSTGLVCVAVAAYWPSLGFPGYRHFDINEKYGDLHIMGVKAILNDILTMRAHGHTLPDRLKGLITFPSFHTAFAVIAIYTVNHIRQCWLRYPLIALNLLMILATPVYGWHYLVDVIGGVIIALLCILCVTQLIPESQE